MQNINVTTIYIQMFPAVKMLQGVQNIMQIQGDQPADNMKFPDNSTTVWGTPDHVKCYSYHAGTSVIVSGGVGMQQCIILNQNEMRNLNKVKNGRKYAANNKQF